MSLNFYLALHSCRFEALWGKKREDAPTKFLMLRFVDTLSASFWVQPWVLIPLEKYWIQRCLVNFIIYPLSKYYFKIFPCKIKTKKVKAKAKMFGEWIIMITRITIFIHSKQIMNMIRWLKFLIVAVSMLCLSTIYLLFYLFLFIRINN